MINLENLQRQCKPAKPKVKTPNRSECCNTKESTIKKVFDCINSHKSITRNLLIKKSETSINSVKRSLKILLDRKKITAEFIGNSGPHKMFRYSTVKK